MDKLYGFFDFIYERLGLVGVFFFYFLFDKVAWPLIKKKYSNGNWVSWKEINTRSKENEKAIGELKTKMEQHIAQSHLDELRLERMESNQEHLKSEDAHIFSQLKSLHDKFDTLTEIMLRK